MSTPDPAVAVELPTKAEGETVPKAEAPQSRLRVALAITLSVIACWGLYGACGALIVYLLGVPVHILWFLVAGIVIGCGSLYLSSRLWVRWHFGLGIVAIVEGAMLARMSIRPLLEAGGADAAIARAIFSTAVIGCAAGAALLIRAVLLKRKQSIAPAK